MKTYSEEEGRSLVIQAGHELVEKQLIARTWGNISARISETEFVITPSGKPYETLTASDLVKVRIEDLFYEGEIKPSSEKGVHAACYQAHPEVNFIIHTHQQYATAISVEGKDFDFAPCAGYALSGTKKLIKMVAESVEKHSESKAFLMNRHGAVCFGTTYEEAFKAAFELEESAKALYLAQATDKSETEEAKPYLDDYAQMMGFGRADVTSEDQEAITLIKEKNRLAVRFAKTAKPLNPFDVLLQHTVYKMKYSKLKNKK